MLEYRRKSYKKPNPNYWLDYHVFGPGLTRTNVRSPSRTLFVFYDFKYNDVIYCHKSAQFNKEYGKEIMWKKLQDL
jgi:hypothetical protein